MYMCICISIIYPQYKIKEISFNVHYPIKDVRCQIRKKNYIKGDMVI